MTKKTRGAGGTDTSGLTHAGTYLPEQLRGEAAKRKKIVPDSVSTLMQRGLAIEADEALGAGALGFMARAMTLASLPHSKPKVTEFERTNGPFTLSIVARSSIGLPYGTVPRLLLAWLTTEAVKTKTRELVLGDSLSSFMRQINLLPTGGRWGTIKRLKEQTRRLFSASIAATYDDGRGVTEVGHRVTDQYQLWWDPKDPTQASLWQSTVTLSEPFFREIIERPVPVDMRALSALKRSPLALDIYVWLTYRMSYLKSPTEISWAALQGQFGAGYPDDDEDGQGLRDFKKHFLRAIQKVLLVYPDAKAIGGETGVRLTPGRPHISKLSK